MKHKLSRRKLMGAAGAAMTPAFAAGAQIPAPRPEGKDTPKVCLESGSGGSADEAGFRRIKQLGVDHVLQGGGRIPWEEARLRELMDRLKSAGLTVGNLMIAGF